MFYICTHTFFIQLIINVFLNMSGIIHEVESDSAESDFSGSSSDFVPEGIDHEVI